MESEATTTAISALNWANGLAFFFNVLATFGSQSAKGMQDNATLSAKYQTLVTPAGYAFSIWGIIFTTQAAWTIMQFGEGMRSSSFVTETVGYGFVSACLAQALWSVVFGLEQITASIVPMVAILVSLLPIAGRILTGSSNDDESQNFWVTAFPMLIHAGWILAATLVNTNVVLVARGASTSVQTLAAWASLAVLVSCGVGLLALPMASSGMTTSVSTPTVVVIPCVLAWASYAVSRELGKPKASIATNFSPEVVARTGMVARNGAFLIMVLVVLVALLR